jgi:hypothetical protein
MVIRPRLKTPSRAQLKMSPISSGLPFSQQQENRLKYPPNRGSKATKTLVTGRNSICCLGLYLFPCTAGS